MPGIPELPLAWRARAGDLEPYAAPAAEAFRVAATELEGALRAAEDEELTLADAAHESGYALRTLREKLASGAIPNAGRKGRPRVRRGDLPRRKGGGGTFDAGSHAAKIVGGSR